MSPSPDLDVQSAFGRRALAYGGVLLLLWLATAGPTAALLGALLRGLGHEVTRVGTVLTVNALPAHAITDPWTAAPVIWLGAAFMLAWPTSLGKRAGGVFLVAFNAILVNLIGLAMMAQTDPRDAAQVTRLELTHGVLMLLVLAVVLLYWTRRVVPEVAGTRIGRARELLAAAEEPVDG